MKETSGVKIKEGNDIVETKLNDSQNLSQKSKSAFEGKEEDNIFGDSGSNESKHEEKKTPQERIRDQNNKSPAQKAQKYTPKRDTDLEKGYILKQMEKEISAAKDKVKKSPRSQMMACLKSHLDFLGEIHFATHTKFEATSNKKKKQMNQNEIDFSSTYISPTMSYQRFAVQGFLKKHVSKKMFFQKKVKYKRYFVLDHGARKMRIHQTNDPHSEYKLMLYTDIKTVKVEPMKLSDRMTIQERWSFQFELCCTNRDYVLYAPSCDEKNLWYHTFKWICECNAFEKHLDENKSFQKTLANTYKQYQSNASEKKPPIDHKSSANKLSHRNETETGSVMENVSSPRKKPKASSLDDEIELRVKQALSKKLEEKKKQIEQLDRKKQTIIKMEGLMKEKHESQQDAEEPDSQSPDVRQLRNSSRLSQQRADSLKRKREMEAQQNNLKLLKEKLELQKSNLELQKKLTQLNQNSPASAKASTVVQGQGSRPPTKTSHKPPISRNLQINTDYGPTLKSQMPPRNQQSTSQTPQVQASHRRAQDSLQLSQQQSAVENAQKLNLNDSIEGFNEHRGRNQIKRQAQSVGANGRKKSKRKKVTIIKKRRERDGSMSVTKQHVFGMTVQQAILAVQGQKYQQHQNNNQSQFDGQNNYQFNITQVFSPSNFSINNSMQNNNQQTYQSNISQSGADMNHRDSNLTSPNQQFRTPHNVGRTRNDSQSFQFDNESKMNLTQQMPRGKRNIVVMKKKRKDSRQDLNQTEIIQTDPPNVTSPINQRQHFRNRTQIMSTGQSNQSFQSISGPVVPNQKAYLQQKRTSDIAQPVQILEQPESIDSNRQIIKQLDQEWGTFAENKGNAIAYSSNMQAAANRYSEQQSESKVESNNWSMSSSSRILQQNVRKQIVKDDSWGIISTQNDPSQVINKRLSKRPTEELDEW